MLSRKIALAALLGAALAVPAMAINSALVSAVKLANQSPWDRDVEGEHAFCVELRVFVGSETARGFDPNRKPF